MTTRKLEKKMWRTFFDRMSKVLDARQAEIEVAALPLGAQVQARHLPLLGVVYDPKSDAIEVALQGLDHLIRKPREIYVDNDITGLAALEIVDGEGVKQIVRFREPLMLPAPQH